MANALILHGTKGSPEANWFRWLEKELQNRGYDVSVPVLPTPENQNLGSWHAAVADFNFTPETIIFGHSCGATFALYLLEQMKQPVARTVLVAPVIDVIDIPEYDALNQTFIEHNFDWQKIKTGSRYIDLFYGDDDPYVPEEQSLLIARQLQIEPRVIPNGGHLNAETGYTKFLQLLELIT